MNAKEYLAYLIDALDHFEPSFQEYQSIMKDWNKDRAKQMDWADYGSSQNQEAQELLGIDPDAHSISELHSAYLNKYIAPAVLGVLPADARATIEQIPIGVLPLRVVNAHALKSPSSEPLIIIDRGLMNMMSYYLETEFCLGFVVQEKGMEAADDYIVRAYRFIINYFAQGGQMSFPQAMVKIPIDVMAAIQACTMATEIFVLGHEMGHVYAGHLDNANTKSMNMNPEGGIRVDCYQKSWVQEYEADAYGWKWYRQAWRGNELVSILGEQGAMKAPLFLFGLIALVERNIESTDRYSSHPPALHRLAHLVLASDDEPSRGAVLSMIELVKTTPVLDG